MNSSREKEDVKILRKSNDTPKRVISKLPNSPSAPTQSKTPRSSSKLKSKLPECTGKSSPKSKSNDQVSKAVPISKRFDEIKKDKIRISKKKQQAEEQKKLVEEAEKKEKQERLAALKEIIPVANSSPVVRNRLNDALQKILEKRSVYDKRPRPFNVMAKIIDVIARHDREIERQDYINRRRAKMTQNMLKQIESPNHPITANSPVIQGNKPISPTASPGCNFSQKNKDDLANKKQCKVNFSINKVLNKMQNRLGCSKNDLSKKLHPKYAKKAHDNISKSFSEILSPKPQISLFQKNSELISTPKILSQPFGHFDDLDLFKSNVFLTIKNGDKMDEELTVASIGVDFLKTLKHEFEKVNKRIQDLEGHRYDSDLETVNKLTSLIQRQSDTLNSTLIKEIDDKIKSIECNKENSEPKAKSAESPREKKTACLDSSSSNLLENVDNIGIDEKHEILEEIEKLEN